MFFHGGPRARVASCQLSVASCQPVAGVHRQLATDNWHLPRPHIAGVGGGAGALRGAPGIGDGMAGAGREPGAPPGAPVAAGLDSWGLTISSISSATNAPRTVSRST